MVNDVKRGVLQVSVDEGYGSPATAQTRLRDKKNLTATAAQQISLLIAKKETRAAKQTLERQLRQADRLAKIGRFSAGVAH